MDWLNTLIALVGLIAWLGIGGWAFAHHVTQPATKDSQIGLLIVFCALFAPFFAGMAIWEIARDKEKSAK